jgi:nucleoid-associated protein YgaU
VGRSARLGVFCLMGLAIALARLVEVELQPQRLVVEAPAALAAEALPPVEIGPEAGEDVVPAASAPAPQERVYEVRPGDTLDKISQAVYGTRKHWRRIQEANRDVIPSPQKMRAGVRLRIPPLEAGPDPLDRVGQSP